MIHETFDLDYWIKKFPLKAVRNRHGGIIITGPQDIALVEQLRTELLRKAPPTKVVPTDVFIWALGEGPDPRVTRFGGLPWMPSADSWPQGASGEPLNFLGQICFADSLDLIPKLPGDLLLIFREPHAEEVDPRAYHGMWTSTGAPGGLRAPGGAAEPPDYQPCYAQRHRTASYPELDGFFKGTSLDQPYLLASLQATAIGLAPFWIQGESKCYTTKMEPFTCIATFGPIGCDQYSAQPFLNQAKLSCEQVADLNHRLHQFGDAGSLYVFLDPRDGAVDFDVQCY